MNMKIAILLFALFVAGAFAPKPTPAPTTTAPLPTTTAPPPPPPVAAPVPGTYTLHGTSIPAWAFSIGDLTPNCPGTVGVRFYSNTTTGYVAGLRILSPDVDIGNVMTARLYSKTGVALSPEVSFPPTDGTVKWLDAWLPTVVNVTPYTEYVAAVYCGDGTKRAFGVDGLLYNGLVSAPHLAAYRGSVAPGNGVMLSGANGFPSFDLGSDPFVDVIYIVPQAN